MCGGKLLEYCVVCRRGSLTYLSRKFQKRCSVPRTPILEVEWSNCCIWSSAQKKPVEPNLWWSKIVLSKARDVVVRGPRRAVPPSNRTTYRLGATSQFGSSKKLMLKRINFLPDIIYLTAASSRCSRTCLGQYHKNCRRTNLTERRARSSL